MSRLKVIVSPFYGGEEWLDVHSGITFRPSRDKIEIYSIPTDSNLTGVREAIRINVLTLVEGTLPEETTVKAETEKKAVIEEITPDVEVAAVETVEEVKEEAPKAKTNNKKRK